MSKSTPVIAGYLWFNGISQVVQTWPAGGLSPAGSIVKFAESGEEHPDIIKCQWVNLTNRTVQDVPAQSIVYLDGNIGPIGADLLIDYDAAMHTLKVTGLQPISANSPEITQTMFYSAMSEQLHLVSAPSDYLAGVPRIMVCKNSTELRYMVDWVNITNVPHHGIPPMAAKLVGGALVTLTLTPNRIVSENGETPFFINEAAAKRSLMQTAKQPVTMFQNIPTLGMQQAFYPLEPNTHTVQVVSEEVITLLTSKKDWGIYDLLKLPLSEMIGQSSKGVELAIQLDKTKQAYLITNPRDIRQVRLIRGWAEVPLLGVVELSELLETLPACFYRKIDFETIAEATTVDKGVHPTELNEIVRLLFANLVSHDRVGFNILRVIDFINDPKSYSITLLEFFNTVTKLCQPPNMMVPPGNPFSGIVMPQTYPQTPQLYPQLPNPFSTVLGNRGQIPFESPAPGGIFPGQAPSAEPKPKARQKRTPR